MKYPYGHNFKKSTRAESERVWAKWQQDNKHRRNVVGFAQRVVELIEPQMVGNRHVAHVAPGAIETARSKYPVTHEEVVEVAEMLVRCWQYGLGFRNWYLRSHEA